MVFAAGDKVHTRRQMAEDQIYYGEVVSVGGSNVLVRWDALNAWNDSYESSVSREYLVKNIPYAQTCAESAQVGVKAQLLRIEDLISRYGGAEYLYGATPAAKKLGKFGEVASLRISLWDAIVELAGCGGEHDNT